MTSDRALYFGFIILFLSLILFIFALIAVQPVIINFKADIHGGFGDVASIANSDFSTSTSFKNPLNGDRIELNPNLKINTSLNRFNATAHVEGRVEVPAYMLAMAAYSNQDITNFSVMDYVSEPNE